MKANWLQLEKLLQTSMVNTLHIKREAKEKFMVSMHFP